MSSTANACRWACVFGSVVGAGDWRFYDVLFPPANWGALGQIRARLAGADVPGNWGTFTGVRIRPFHAFDAVRLLSGIRLGGKMLAVVPRQPAIGLRRDIPRVQLELIQVVQRADAGQLAAVNQAHVNVANQRAAAGFVEHRVLAMKNRFFQRPFTKVIVQRRAGFAQEQRQ